MNTQILEQVETIEVLDFEPSCQRVNDCAGNRGPVTHLAESVQCGCARLICQPCTEYFLELIRQNPGPYGICLACNTTLWGTARECIRLVPIK